MFPGSATWFPLDILYSPDVSCPCPVVHFRLLTCSITSLCITTFSSRYLAALYRCFFPLYAMMRNLRLHSGAVAQWRSGAVRSGAVGQWRSGAVAQWRSGAVAQWRSGAVAQWRSGAVRSGAVARALDSRLRESGLVQRCWTLGKFVHSTLLQFTQLYEWTPSYYTLVNICL